MEAWGASFAEALSQAVAGFASILVDPASLQRSEHQKMEVTATDRENLVVRVLSNILYRFDAGHFVPQRLEITTESQTLLQGLLFGEPLQSHHRLRIDVKAVTYHQLSVKQTRGGFSIRVFLDI